MADPQTAAPDATAGYDLVAARAAAAQAGLSPAAGDAQIAAYLAPLHGYDLAGARASAEQSGLSPEVADAQIVDFLSRPTAPPPPAAPPSSMLNGMGKAAAQVPTDIAGHLVGAIGAMKSSLGTAVTGAAANAEDFAQQQLGVMDRIDAGHQVDPANDPLGYADASPEQRAAIRSGMEQAIAETPPPAETGLGQVGGALQAAGAGEQAAGASIVGYGEAAHPLTEEEQQRFSVQSVKAIGSLIPYVGMAVAGGLPAVVGLAGVQGFGSGYDAAKAKGATDVDAATRGSLEALVSAGMMTVPIAEAMNVAAKIPAAFKGQFLTALWESAKSGATLTAFTQLQTIADNVVAKGTQEPDRSLTAGVGQNLGPTFIAGAIIPASVAAFQAATGRQAPRPAVPDILKADNVDGAIDAAKAVAETAAPIDLAAHAATLDAGDGTDQQQAKLLRMFDHANVGKVGQAPDGTYQLDTQDARGEPVTAPIRAWDPGEASDLATEPEEGAAPTIPPETAQAIRDHFAAAGIDTVFYQDHPGIPFDGSHDPQQPDTIFVSNNPTRAVAQVAGHEFTHALADTILPDGTNLGDALNRLIASGEGYDARRPVRSQIAGGLTLEGQRYAESTFAGTAPERAAFPAGPEGDAAHAAAFQAHLVNEMGADIGAEAPQFLSFLPRVIDAVQARFGDTVAGNALSKLITRPSHGAPYHPRPVRRHADPVAELGR